MLHKGIFITFEGGDGAGKTTLIEKIYRSLTQEGCSVTHTHAPGGTPLGAQIRRLLLEDGSLSTRAELFLFLADRAQHVDECILPALNKQHIVLCDRFNDSTLAYQGGARGFDIPWLEKLLTFASKDLKPDLTIYLDVDPGIGFARAQKKTQDKDRIEAEDLLFHKKIQDAFRHIAQREPERVFLIDALGTPEQVFNQAKEKIDALLSSHRK